MTPTRATIEGDHRPAGRHLGPGVPHDQFDRLRREAPVYRHPEPDGPGFWAVTKHADVRAVSHDSATFSSGWAARSSRPGREALAQIRLTILNMDPPKHNRYRRLVSRGFTPRMIGKLVEDIERRAAKVVDDVCEARSSSSRRSRLRSRCR